MLPPENMIHKYELIFFDFDGTLADTFDDIINSVQDTLSELGLPLISRENIRSNIGRGIHHLIRTCLSYTDEDFLPGALEIFRRNYNRRCLETTTLYPAVAELLEEVKSKKLVILSNKEVYFVIKIVKHLGIKEYFCDIPSAHEPGLIKPSPVLIGQVREKYGTASDKCIIIGDMKIDIETGKAASIATCAVTTGLERREDLLFCRPDFIVDSLSEIL